MQRFFAWTRLSVVLALITLGRLPGCTLTGCQQPLPQDSVVKGDVAGLAGTFISAHLEYPIAAGTNVIWCSTFQLAWNELHALIGEDIHFNEDPPMVEVLNRMTATSDDIDDASYVAMAGFVGDGILDAIRQQMETKFPSASPELIPSGQGLRPEDIVTYAYLFKSLMFPVPFERLDDPLWFGPTEVSAFGVGPESKAGHGEMYAQVLILDYLNSEDFVIELETESTGDQVILAKVAPGSTLGGTVQSVLSRIARGTSEWMQPGDRLEIPKVNFDITRTYDELMDRELVVENPDVADDLSVLDARQAIRFDLSEEGVVLESEATMTLGCAASAEPTPSHVMVFDRPFLIMIRRVEASQPYFAMWVDNAELLVKSAG